MSRPRSRRRQRPSSSPYGDDALRADVLGRVRHSVEGLVRELSIWETSLSHQGSQIDNRVPWLRQELVQIAKASSQTSVDLERLCTAALDACALPHAQRETLHLALLRLVMDVPSTAWNLIQLSPLLSFLEHATSNCLIFGTASTKGMVLASIFGTIHDILQHHGKKSSAVVISAVRSTCASLSESLRVALFHSITCLNIDGPGSTSCSSASSAFEGSSSGADLETENPVRQRLLMTRSSRLKLRGLDALIALAAWSPTDFIPFWGYFLPDHDGVSRPLAGSRNQETLASMILYDRNSDVRGKAAAAITALLHGCWRFFGQTPGQANETGDRPRPSFSSTTSRVTRACTVLFDVAATAIRTERSPVVLARFIRLASVLCDNARTPQIAASKVCSLLAALRSRVGDKERTDLTSRSAALSCIAIALQVNGRALRNADEAEAVLSCVLNILSSDATVPVDEGLAALRSVLRAAEDVAVARWLRADLHLHRIFLASQNDSVRRLHVMRCVLAVTETGSRPQFPDNALSRLWLGFVSAGVSDAFHPLRVCAVRCVKNLLSLRRDEAMLCCLDREQSSDVTVDDLVKCLIETAVWDDVSAVRSAALQSMSALAGDGCSPCCRLVLYEALVLQMEHEEEDGLRAKCFQGGALHVSRIRWEGGVCRRYPSSKLWQLLMCHKDLSSAVLSAKRLSTGTFHDAERWPASEVTAVHSVGCILKCVPEYLVVEDRSDVQGKLGDDDVMTLTEDLCAVLEARGSQKLQVNACQAVGAALSNNMFWASARLERSTRRAVDRLLRVAKVAIDAKVKEAAVVAVRQCFAENALDRLAALDLKTLVRSILDLVDPSGEAVSLQVPTGQPSAVPRKKDVFACESLALFFDVAGKLSTAVIDSLVHSGVEMSSVTAFSGLVERLELPEFALLGVAQDPPFDERNEEMMTAVDVWKSLPQCAARLIRNVWAFCSTSSENEVEKERLRRAVNLVQRLQ